MFFLKTVMNNIYRTVVERTHQEIMWNANLIQIGNFIDVFLA